MANRKINTSFECICGREFKYPKSFEKHKNWCEYNPSIFRKIVHRVKSIINFF